MPRAQYANVAYPPDADDLNEVVATGTLTLKTHGNATKVTYAYKTYIISNRGGTQNFFIPP